MPSRIAEVLEIAKSGLLAGNKQNVIAITRLKIAEVPIPLAFHLPTHAGYDRPCDDLLQRRIPLHCVRKPARRFRVCATKLNRSGRSIALCVSSEHVDAWCNSSREADRGIETLEGMM